MTDERVVLMDTDGNYYLLTPEMLAQARVPAEHAAQMRTDLEQHGAGDVSGFSLLVTSQAVGEEAGTGGSPSLTTMAVGEEGGSGRPLPGPTTRALGEASGGVAGPINLPFQPPWFR